MITITRPSKGVRSRKRKREIEDRRSESLGGGGFREASEQDGSNGSSEMEENICFLNLASSEITLFDASNWVFVPTFEQTHGIFLLGWYFLFSH